MKLFHLDSQERFSLMTIIRITSGSRETNNILQYTSLSNVYQTLLFPRQAVIQIFFQIGVFNPLVPYVH